ncbi:hypothetical protein C4J95_2673 [Pseudomonas orientalis]|nr:hypothetical protein C4J95_2673 [Pseudomonas orientalis]
MTLVFLPAMYAIWFKIRPEPESSTQAAKPTQALSTDR